MLLPSRKMSGSNALGPARTSHGCASTSRAAPRPTAHASGTRREWAPSADVQVGQLHRAVEERKGRLEDRERAAIQVLEAGVRRVGDVDGVEDRPYHEEVPKAQGNGEQGKETAVATAERVEWGW